MILRYAIFVSLLCLVLPAQGIFQGKSRITDKGDRYSVTPLKQVVPDSSIWQKIEPVLKQIYSSKGMNAYDVVSHVKTISELTGKPLSLDAMENVSLMIDDIVNDPSMYPYDKKFFFEKTIPHLASLALHLPKLFPKGIEVLYESCASIVSLTKLHVAALIAGGIFRVVLEDAPVDLWFECNNKAYKLESYQIPDLKKTLKSISLTKSDFNGIFTDSLSIHHYARTAAFRAFDFYRGFLLNKSKLSSLIAYANTITHLFAPYFAYNADAGYDVFVNYDILNYPFESFEPTSPLERIDFIYNEAQLWRREYDWIPSTEPLRQISFLENCTMEDAPQALHVNFSNEYFGQGVFHRDVPEEEHYMIMHPETLPLILLSTYRNLGEAVTVVGAERFANCTAEAGRLRFESCAASSWEQSVSQQTSLKGASSNSVNAMTTRVPLDEFHRREIAVASMNAQNFLPDEIHEQYRDHRFLWENMKAYSGFATKAFGGFSTDPKDLLHPTWPVVTGDWGQKVGGHLQLKFLIQWMGASAAERDIKYCLSNAPELNDIQNIYQKLAAKYQTIASLYSSLLEVNKKYSEPGNESGELHIFDDLLS